MKEEVLNFSKGLLTWLSSEAEIIGGDIFINNQLLNEDQVIYEYMQSRLKKQA